MRRRLPSALAPTRLSPLQGIPRRDHGTIGGSVGIGGAPNGIDVITDGSQPAATAPPVGVGESVGDGDSAGGAGAVGVPSAATIDGEGNGNGGNKPVELGAGAGCGDEPGARDSCGC